MTARHVEVLGWTGGRYDVKVGGEKVVSLNAEELTRLIKAGMDYMRVVDEEEA